MSMYKLFCMSYSHANGVLSQLYMHFLFATQPSPLLYVVKWTCDLDLTLGRLVRNPVGIA